MAEVGIVFYPFVDRSESWLIDHVRRSYAINQKDIEAGRLRLEFRYPDGEVIKEIPLVANPQKAGE